MFSELAKLFSKTALQVCEGQQYDVDFETRNDVTIDGVPKNDRVQNGRICWELQCKWELLLLKLQMHVKFKIATSLEEI